MIDKGSVLSELNSQIDADLEKNTHSVGFAMWNFQKTPVPQLNEWNLGNFSFELT